MTRYERAILALLPLLLQAGCTHTLISRGVDAPRIALSASPMQVAVVMRGVPTELSARAGASTYVLKNAAGVFERVVYTSLQDAFVTVRFVKVAEPGFDLLLYPLLQVNEAGAVRLQLQITDSRQQLLATATEQREDSGAELAWAMSDIFDRAARAALPIAMQALAEQQAAQLAAQRAVARPEPSQSVASASKIFPRHNTTSKRSRR